MIKVAAYCRVSTDKDDQINSFESQKGYFERQINLNPDWELTEIYADEGLTGTSTKKRKAFNKMMEGRTSFIVAHRLQTIMDADKIIVMKDGHIIETGNHEELLTKGGFYSELFKSQFMG